MLPVYLILRMSEKHAIVYTETHQNAFREERGERGGESCEFLRLVFAGARQLHCAPRVRAPEWRRVFYDAPARRPSILIADGASIDETYQYRFVGRYTPLVFRLHTQA